MRSLFAAAGFLLVSLPALAQPAIVERLKATQGDPVSLKVAIEAGRKASFFCANCHGENGVSNMPEVPNLAGQHFLYLQNSITRYRDGTGIRNNRLMSIATAPQKNDDIIAVVNYLVQLP